ncbi:hypothetical protein [Pseudoalteromonas denitrificans]|jgi:hypothetical protein|uniref:Uncharacterized protein n=1 Tax=Pseudoalteromonas denitrificans DSM 6059 TaxID=1123010 RepID=A0A1I1RJV1_9GAMM|nr:hypothetical protein [Pseudoalteromonas denitrificans]SFD34586.1 hypothetical protein SAMN02745724_04263 [Pseudoalteromonas denitrificans DSM 6059]
MKLKLNKKKLKNLSADKKMLPEIMTPFIAGGDEQTLSKVACGSWNGACHGRSFGCTNEVKCAPRESDYSQCEICPTFDC